MLEYSAKNPDGMEERRKIQELLTKSEDGKISIKEVFSRKSSTILTTFFSRGKNSLVKRISRTRDNAWMTQLTSTKFAHYVPKFYELAKKWLGDDESDLSVMHNLVEAVKVSLERHWVLYNSSSRKSNTESGQKYRSCAVVGNSGILLSRSYGAQIDSHDVVIRLNNADILMYKEHVGSKTSISFMNSNVFRFCSRKPDCWCHPYGREVPIVLYICQAMHLMDVAYCSPRYDGPVVVTESKLDALCGRIAKWYSLKHFVEVAGKSIYEWDSVHNDVYFHYSSGMEAIVMALGICDSVEIFGFGNSLGAKHHYHTNQEKELAVHDYEAEYIFYDDLINNRTIPFLTDAGISIPPVRMFF